MFLPAEAAVQPHLSRQSPLWRYPPATGRHLDGPVFCGKPWFIRFQVKVETFRTKWWNLKTETSESRLLRWKIYIYRFSETVFSHFLSWWGKNYFLSRLFLTKILDVMFLFSFFLRPRLNGTSSASKKRWINHKPPRPELFLLRRRCALGPDTHSQEGHPAQTWTCQMNDWRVTGRLYFNFYFPAPWIFVWEVFV